MQISSSRSHSFSRLLLQWFIGGCPTIAGAFRHLGSFFAIIIILLFFLSSFSSFLSRFLTVLGDGGLFFSYRFWFWCDSWPFMRIFSVILTILWGSRGCFMFSWNAGGFFTTFKRFFLKVGFGFLDRYQNAAALGHRRFISDSLAFTQMAGDSSACFREFPWHSTGILVNVFGSDSSCSRICNIGARVFAIHWISGEGGA